MQLNVQTSAPRPSMPLHQARKRTRKVCEQLEVASAELGLSNAVLGRNLPENVKRSNDVRHALSRNEAMEEKVQEAADELKVVSDLLQEESAERERLERELASRPAA